MTPEQRERARELFHELFPLKPAQRKATLREREIEPAVLAEVSSLLDADIADLFDEDKLGAVGQGLLEQTSAHPVRIAGYRIVRLLGSGGMGRVHLARDQATGGMVAVKTLRPEFMTDSLVARFEREGHILRLLDHPGIAAYHGFGQTEAEDGAGSLQPCLYLVMEYVDGATLTEHAEQEQLDDHGRIELLARVCDAVQHAHAAGVIHRDLKPNNVLVDLEDHGPGQPKVLDFGVARVRSSAQLQTLTRTDAVSLLGTIPYMSPEQVAGDGRAVDARSDVYSLGVMLFELLTSRLPYAVRGRPAPLAMRIILEEEPSRLGSVVARLGGPLEAVVARALEKEPTHRYATAADLADDLRRHLAGRTVFARQPSALRQFGKLARRHKTIFSGLAVAVAALAVGLVGSIAFALREVASNEREREARRIAEASAYHAQVTAATMALTHGDIALAAKHLDQAPPQLRNWEWRHLESRLSGHALRMQADPLGRNLRPSLLLAADGRSLHVVSQQAAKAATYARFETGSGERTADRTSPTIHQSVLDPFSLRLVTWRAGRVVSMALPATGVPNLVELADMGAPLHAVAVARRTGQVLALSVNGALWRFPSSNSDAAPLRLPHQMAVGPLFVSERGRWVAIRRRDNLWLGSADDPDIAWELPLTDWAQNATIAFSPDETLMAVALSGGRIALWSLSDGAPPRRVRTLTGHREDVRALAFTDDGTLLAAGAEDSAIRLWNPSDGESAGQLIGHHAPVRALAFAPDGSRLASLGEDGELLLWDLPAHDPRVLDHGVYLYAVASSPDDRRLYTGASDGSVRVFDAETCVEIARFLPSRVGALINELAVDPRGGQLAVSLSVREGSALLVLDADTGRELLRREGGPGRKRRWSLSYSPDGRRLAAHSRDEGVVVFDTANWSEIDRRRATEYASATRTFPNRLRHAPDGKRLALATLDGQVLLLGADNLEQVALLSGPEDGPRGLAFRPDGRELATCWTDGTVRLWQLPAEAPAGEPVDDEWMDEPTVLRGNSRAVYAVAWSPDGSRLFSGSEDTTLRVWDGETHEEIVALREHTDYVYAIAVSADGRRLITASGDGSARVWDDVTRGERLAARQRHAQLVTRWEPDIRERLAGGTTPENLARELRGRAGLSEREREVALQVLLREAITRRR